MLGAWVSGGSVRLHGLLALSQGCPTLNKARRMDHKPVSEPFGPEGWRDFDLAYLNGWFEVLVTAVSVGTR